MLVPLPFARHLATLKLIHPDIPAALLCSEQGYILSHPDMTAGLLCFAQRHILSRPSVPAAVLRNDQRPLVHPVSLASVFEKEASRQVAP